MLLVVAIVLSLLAIVLGLVIAWTPVPAYSDGGRADQRTVHIEPFVPPADETSADQFPRLVDAPASTPNRSSLTPPPRKVAA